MTKFGTSIWMAASAMLLVGCSGSTEEEKPADPVALVTLARAEAGAVAGTVTIYGAAEPSPGSKLALVAPAEGVVLSIDAPPGTAVRAGQVVARLAPSPTTRLDLSKASSDARVADLALARAQRLRADGLGSNAEVESARAAARSADLTRSSLAARSGGLLIRASTAGVVDAVTPSPGDVVQPGGDVASITRDGAVRARFGADPELARTLRPGMPLRIKANAGRPALTVPVESIAPTIDPQTRLVAVFARVPAGSAIVAGEALAADAPASRGSGGVSVPYAALLDDAGQPYVFVVANGVAHRHDVTVQAQAGGRVSLAGIGAGDAVVVEGGTAVEDGMKVRTR
ncbi:efflux RND transporter periplasmic adaptor subunit [Sphingomonas sp.]|uniref:efflux RND transporter periplasmic adaptor subunit n=1 Tax=Sphingomonas sp. TaxID=28214 RepID=UPI003CC6647C